MRQDDSWHEITAQVKEQTDIVTIIAEHVDLKKSGVRYLGLCPFHGEKTPSFSVNRAQQFYYCFGCGASGDVYSFVMKYQHVDFPEALKILAGRLNIALPEKKRSEAQQRREEDARRLYTVTDKAAGIYRRYLVEDRGGEAGRDYLLKREIPLDIQQRFQLGYAPATEKAGWDYLCAKLSLQEQRAAERTGLIAKNKRGGYYDRFRNRVLFPIHDLRGRVCGFGGRILGEDLPKYMNSPESEIFSKGRLLFGLHQNQDEIRKQRLAVIVEGNFDLIALAAYGCNNVVAPLGTALTENQIKLLKRYADQAVLLFDGDTAGVKAALRAAPLFFAAEMDATVALLPENHDPDSFVREKGKAALLSLLENGVELSRFILDELIKKYGLGLEGKRKIAEELKDVIAATPSSLQRSVTVAHFAEKLGLVPQQLEKLMSDTVTLPSAERKNASLLERDVPRLSPSQKRLVEIIVLNPGFFYDLDGLGLRAVLAGGIGEIVYLQVRELLEKGMDVQPEDVLSALPAGPERKMVSEMLLQASEKHKKNHLPELIQEEFAEVRHWLTLENLRILSKKLDHKILEAQQENDFDQLRALLAQKQEMEVTRQKLHEKR